MQRFYGRIPNKSGCSIIGISKWGSVSGGYISDRDGGSPKWWSIYLVDIDIRAVVLNAFQRALGTKYDNQGINDWT